MASRSGRALSPAPTLFPSLAARLAHLGRTEPLGRVEQCLAEQGATDVIGVDEAGRGPLAGPVMVCAVWMPLSEQARWLAAGLDDSKRLSTSERERLAPLILSSLRTSVVAMTPAEVDALNVLRASLEGMRRAVEGLGAPLGIPVLVDGNQPIPRLMHEQASLVRGDSRSLAIAAASIVAKEARDRRMVEMEAEHPGYGFGRHKGYPVPEHLRALERLGVTVEHRRTFGPVARMLASEKNAGGS